MTEMVSECFAKVSELAITLGVHPINRLPGLWIHAIDHHWLIQVNGHRQQVDDVPAFCMLVKYNGWAAGLIHPLTGGVIAGGALANEDTFIEAIDQAIVEAR